MDALMLVTAFVVVLVVGLTWERVVRTPHLRSASNDGAAGPPSPAVWVEPRPRVVRRNWLLALMGLASIALIVPVSWVSNEWVHAVLLGVVCYGGFFVPLWLVLRGPRIEFEQPATLSN
jgi:hypothetical protein